MSFNIKFYSFQKQNFDETRRRKTLSAKISSEERYFKLYSLANSVIKVGRQNFSDISSKNERGKGHTASLKIVFVDEDDSTTICKGRSLNSDFKQMFGASK